MILMIRMRDGKGGRGNGVEREEVGEMTLGRGGIEGTNALQGGKNIADLLKGQVLDLIPLPKMKRL